MCLWSCDTCSPTICNPFAVVDLPVTAPVQMPIAMCLQVFQVRMKSTGQIYAMKIMRKEKILEKDHGEYVKSERDALTAVFHPYIVTLRYSFQVRSAFAALLRPAKTDMGYVACEYQAEPAMRVRQPMQSRYTALTHLTCLQTATKLYLVLDFINGGHLFFQLYRAVSA